jgi:flagellar biosynthetic protein FliQ
MTPESVVGLFGEAIFLVMLMASVMIVPSLLVGLVISVFQAATQINEQTLSFFPRLLTTLTALLMAGPWLLQKLVDFSQQVMAMVPHFIH